MVPKAPSTFTWEPDLAISSRTISPAFSSLPMQSHRARAESLSDHSMEASVSSST
ncbi:hypothetical protein ACUY3P_06105 [Corynebacterium lehmanniae]